MKFWLRLRDRLLASARFQQAAARFPLTRRVARREARALFDLCAGFVYSQVLVACVELDVFEQLAAGPVAPEVLAARLDVPPAAIMTLLNAACALRLLAPVAEAKFRLGALGAALRGNPGAVAMIRHHRMFYADMADPVALLRGETSPALRQFWPYQGQGQAEAYSKLMALSQPMIAAQVLAAYDFRRHRCLLDVGGGDGSFLAAVTARAPALRLQLFDLPEVAALAAARLSSGAMVRGGDFRNDPLPTGADLVTLIRVLHDNDDATVLRILQAVHAVLPPDGVLLIAEPMAGTPSARQVGEVYFGFYLLAMGNGRPRRLLELQGLLRQAGFAAAREHFVGQPMLARVFTTSPL